MLKRILIACDKFKGSLSALAACQSLQKGIEAADPLVQCDVHPMADGGEGSLSILAHHLGLEIHTVEVTDPLGLPLVAAYGIRAGAAYIETAAACGLQLLASDERDPMKTSTYGVGLILSDAIRNGCCEIHLFVGGSATNDGGTGMAAALGYTFEDVHGEAFIPTGGSLMDISVIRPPASDILAATSFRVWCDVGVPLLGPTGASQMFAAQKGAAPDHVDALEAGLQHLSLLWGDLGVSAGIAAQAGAGAAGGLAAGGVAFLGASLHLGIDFIMEATKLATKIQQADCVITGEGAIDDQSTEGKVVAGIARLCQQYHTPLVLVAGIAPISAEKLAQLSPQRIHTIMGDGITVEQAMAEAATRLEAIGTRIGVGRSD